MANFISVISCGCVRGGVGTCRGHLPPSSPPPPFPATPMLVLYLLQLMSSNFQCNIPGIYVTMSFFRGSILYVLMILCKENQTKQILGICLSHWKNEFIVNHSEIAVYIYI